MIQLSLNTPSAASNASVYDGCIAAGLVGFREAEAALLQGSANVLADNLEIPQ